jgi:DNA-binding transcriptional LysR family regulator
MEGESGCQMDIRQLRYFVTIAHEGQITRAAKQLNIEQPPLSRQLRLMEEELGVLLFERMGKRLKLTDAGELLRRKAELLLFQYEETIREVKENEEGLRGVLSIGAVVSCIALLPQHIKKFRAEFPQVTYKIVEGDHFYLGELLEQRKIELIVTRLPFEAMSDAQQYAILPLPSDPYVVVIPSSWTDYAGRTAIQMKELVNVPLITLKTDQTTQMHERVVSECRRFGVEPNFICECSSVAIAMSLIAAGIGATVFPKSVISTYSSDTLHMLDIVDADFESEMAIVWLQNRQISRRALRFIDGFREI